MSDTQRPIEPNHDRHLQEGYYSGACQKCRDEWGHFSGTCQKCRDEWGRAQEDIEEES